MGGSNSKRKRQPSAPRLDATGFLMHEPDDLPCPSVAWVDQPTGTGVVTSYDNDPGGSPVTVTFYNALKYGEYTISVGDDIALTPEKKGEGTELCTVKAFYAVDDPDEPMRMTVRWFWRPEHLELEESGEKTGKHELFFTSSEDAHNSEHGT